MSTIVEFPSKTTAPLTPEAILKRAPDWADMDGDMLIIAYDQDGDPAVASTTSDIPKIIYLIEKFKLGLLSHMGEG